MKTRSYPVTLILEPSITVDPKPYMRNPKFQVAATVGMLGPEAARARLDGANSFAFFGLE